LAHLKALRLPAMRERFQELGERARREGLSYEAYLLALCEAENEMRRETRIERLMRASRLPREKTLEAGAFKMLKVKLGRDNDREMIETVRSVTDVPIFVDVNQGWKDRVYAMEMAHFLNENNCLFIEQPMHKDQKDDIAWLTAGSPLPIIADEALQTVGDMLGMKGIYSGINIKLMKCGGMHAAYKMVTMARQMGMKILIGCMTETSCAVSAAAQLSPLVDWADLDGNLLISNDVYEGMTVVDGRVSIPDRPGIGIIEKK